MTKGKMYQVIKTHKEFTKEGYVIVEWWKREGNIITITEEKISARDYMDLQFLYDRVDIKEPLSGEQ